MVMPVLFPLSGASSNFLEESELAVAGGLLCPAGFG